MERPDRMIERARLGCDLSIKEEFELYIKHLEKKLDDTAIAKTVEEKIPASYREKMEIIFSNKLEYNGDNRKAIEDVKAWLCCEWQCNNMSMEDYSVLLEMVEPIAEKMIREL